MSASRAVSRSFEWLEPYGIARYGPAALPVTAGVLVVTAAAFAADRLHVRAVPNAAIVAWSAFVLAYFAGLTFARRRVRFDGRGFVVRGACGWGFPRTIPRQAFSHVRVTRWYAARLFLVQVFAGEPGALGSTDILRLSLFSIGPPLAFAESLAANGLLVEIPDADLMPRAGDRPRAYVWQAAIACAVVLAAGLAYEFSRPVERVRLDAVPAPPRLAPR